MEVWQWVLVYALVLALAQLLVYLYLRGEDRSFELSEEGERGQGTPPNAAPSQPYAPPAQQSRNTVPADPQADAHHAVSPDEEAIVCRHCGARNEREGIYSYCRSCTSELGV